MEPPSQAWAPERLPPLPFWKRIPRFFSFPAYLPPLLRNLGLSVLLAVAITSGMPLVAALVALISAVVIVRYGFLVIERASQGYLRPEDYPPMIGSPHAWRPYKMFAVLVLAFFALGLLVALTRSGFVLTLGLVLIALALPASVMSMAQADSLREAMNPVRLANIALRIGAPYLVLCLFLFLLMSGSNTAFELVEPLLERHVWLLAGASSFVGNYFFLIMCALIGYVMYQYHDELGVAVTGPGDSGRPVLKGRVDLAARSRDALVGQLVADGDLPAAVSLVAEALTEKPNDLSLHARLRRLLVAQSDALRLEEHSDKYLALLVRSGNLGEALTLVEEEAARRGQFQPREAALIPPLARHALEHGKPQLAASLLRGFDKRFPGAPETAEVYLLGARLMHEAARDDARARRMFEHVIASWPQQPAAAEAARRLAALDRAAPLPG